MQKSKRELQILQNLQDEQNVPKPVVDDVFQKLARIVGKATATSSPLDQFEEALQFPPESACVGLPAGLGQDILARFTPLARIADQPEAKKCGYNETKLRANPEKLRKLLRIVLGRLPRNIVWATIQDLVRKEMDNGATIEDVVNRLGLTARLTIPMVEINYATNDVPTGIKVPTTFDAGTMANFRPPPKGAKQGTTKPCSGHGPGYPEYVHKGCVIDQPRLKLHNPTPT